MTRDEMAKRLENINIHVADLAAAELRKTCAWTPDEDGTWDSGCYNKCFDTSSPSENQFRFCPFCGGNLEEVK